MYERCLQHEWIAFIKLWREHSQDLKVIGPWVLRPNWHSLLFFINTSVEENIKLGTLWCCHVVISDDPISPDLFYYPLLQCLVSIQAPLRKMTSHSPDRQWVFVSGALNRSLRYVCGGKWRQGVGCREFSPLADEKTCLNWKLRFISFHLS